MRKTLMTLAAVFTLAGSTAYADSITKPTTFTSGTTISSSQMNANFDTVYDQVDNISSALSFGQFSPRRMRGELCEPHQSSCWPWSVPFS